MDLISNFPTDIIVLVSWTGNISECAHTGLKHVCSLYYVHVCHSGDVLRVLSMARLNRLLRVYKLVSTCTA